MEQTDWDDFTSAFAPLVALQTAWLQWNEDLLKTNKFPLSGNVDQFIKTWGEAVGQIGFLNVNVAGSGNPPLERKIGSSFSYGRQLGRILDVLAPLVKANPELFKDSTGKDAVKDFDEMVRKIQSMKNRSVDEIVGDVKQWDDEPTEFQAKLAALLAELEALKRQPRRAP